MAAKSLSELGDIADQIARFEAVLEDAKKDRDSLVVALLDQGYSEREVATAAGVSNVRVHQIKETARVRA